VQVELGEDETRSNDVDGHELKATDMKEPVDVENVPCSVIIQELGSNGRLTFFYTLVVCE
jgi:hypothetical protein